MLTNLCALDFGGDVKQFYASFINDMLEKRRLASLTMSQLVSVQQCSHPDDSNDFSLIQDLRLVMPGLEHCAETLVELTITPQGRAGNEYDSIICSANELQHIEVYYNPGLRAGQH